MHRSEWLGLVLALPGIALAATVFALLAYSTAVCDPLYEPNRLLEPEFLQEIGRSLRRNFQSPSELPARPDLKLARDLTFPASCTRAP